MTQTIFLSWQHDTLPKNGHYFLKSVLEEVCRSIQSDTAIAEAERDVVPDSDTTGVPGQPHIVDAILKKIDAASIFIADLTYTGRTWDDKKYTPNANVLLEYGWALKSLGSSRVISLMNVAYGGPEKHPLPFDLGHYRWPTRFNLPETATNSDRKTELVRLSAELKRAVLAALTEHQRVSAENSPKHEAIAPAHGRARFRSKGTPLGTTWGHASSITIGPPKKVYMARGAAVYLRVIPVSPLSQPLSAISIARAYQQPGPLRFRPITYQGALNSFRAEDGAGTSWMIDGDNRTESAVFAFESGELWSIDTAGLRVMGDGVLSVDFLEEELPRALQGYLEFLNQLGVTGRLRWKVGLEGVSGRRFYHSGTNNPLMQMYGANEIVSDGFESEGTVALGDNTKEALLPFFNRLYHLFGYDYQPN